LIAADAARGTRVRALRPDERQVAVLWGVLAVSSVLLRPLWLTLAPLLPSCPFRSLTGIPCPSCGTTRAAMALLHGDIVAALTLNPLAAAAGLAFLVGGVIAPVWALASLPVPRLDGPPARTIRLTLVAVLLLDWAWVLAVG
jgi:hypothetical protein